jgi:hypothetical protein
MVEEYKVAKCRLVMTIRDSKDEKVRDAGIQTRSGRKWAASTEVKRAEDMLMIHDIVGNTNTGRAGLGNTKFRQWQKSKGKERRDMVLNEVRKVEENTRRTKAVELGQQGAWTRWTVPERRLTWADIWKMEPLRIKFLIRAVYDTLPTPTNLTRWGLTEDTTCKLCGGSGTLSHILSGCKTALSQGRYRWRHDKVLQVLAEVLEKERKKPRPEAKQGRGINFVKEGEKTKNAQPRRPAGLSDGAS